MRFHLDYTNRTILKQNMDRVYALGWSLNALKLKTVDKCNEIMKLTYDYNDVNKMMVDE